jgi:hypothetical protein
MALLFVKDNVLQIKDGVPILCTAIANMYTTNIGKFLLHSKMQACALKNGPLTNYNRHSFRALFVGVTTGLF